MARHEMELTMFPGSFIWRRISHEWLVSKAASAWFAISSAMIAVMTIVLFSNVQIRDISFVSRFSWGIAGVLTAVSIFFLWGGMWRYWITSDSSGRIGRRLWFVVLLAGIWYGAIIYYILVFLPTTREGARKHMRSMAK
jgi:hypothetical protein